MFERIATALRLAFVLLALSLVGAVLLAPAPAHAADKWTGEDKVLHAVYSCTAGVAAYALAGADRPWLAFGLAMLPGIRKEWFDQKHKAAQGNGWSWKDLAADAAGAGGCVGAMRWTFTRSNGTTQVAFSTPF